MVSRLIRKIQFTDAQTEEAPEISGRFICTFVREELDSEVKGNIFCKLVI